MKKEVVCTVLGTTYVLSAFGKGFGIVFYGLAGSGCSRSSGMNGLRV